MSSRHEQHHPSRGNPRALETGEIRERPTSVCAYERRISELNAAGRLGYSRSKVKRLAYKLHSAGVRAEDLAHVITYADPTGETAARNADRRPKKNGPETRTAKHCLEAA